ncbi:MAG: hypothetical protein KME17_10270 [Cyanosarcina radialis HA8281-LM2]|nr:hypothetical protein [Cyanosarcina radialis HA8281-LM2]
MAIFASERFILNPAIETLKPFLAPLRLAPSPTGEGWGEGKPGYANRI